MRIPKRWLRKLYGESIKSQLTVLLFALTAVAIGIIGFIGVRGVHDTGNRAEKLTASAAETRAEQLLTQTTDAIATKNSIIFNDIQSITENTATFAENILNNPALFNNGAWRFDDHIKRVPQGYYTNSKDEPTSIYFQSYIKLTPQVRKDMEQLSYLNYTLPQAAQSQPDAVAFYFLGTQGQTLYYPNISVGEVVPPDYNPTNDDFYQVAAPKNNPEKKVRLSKVYDDPVGHGLLLSASAPIYTKTDEFKGIIGMDISLGNIAKNIEAYSPIEGSYAFLIDEGGRAIALPEQAYKDMLGRAAKPDEFGVSLKNAASGFAPTLTEMRNGKRGFTKTETGGKRLYIAYAPVSGTRFNLGIVAEESVILKVVGDLRSQVDESRRQVLYGQIIPAAIVLLGLVWIVGFFYIRRITQPVIALTNQTRRITGGHFQDKVTVHSSNEIGKLAVAFNTMTGELAKSYKTLHQKVRQLATANAKDTAIIKSIGDGLIVADSDSRVLIINDLASKLLNVSAKKVMGRKLAGYELYDAHDQPLPEDKYPMQAALTTGKKVQSEVSVFRKNKTIKTTLSITATPVVQAGEIIGTIQTIRDVTHEKEVDRMKTEFISVASHQLRTPLSAIKWFSEMLVVGEAGKLTDEQKDYAQNIAASAARMNDLVNALLNISRVESGRFAIHPEPTDVGTLLQEVANGLKDQAAKRKQRVIVDVAKDLPPINLDPNLIGLVYTNLLANAIKYTPEGGKITISVSPKDNQLVSTITDTGYGIPEAEQHKVFQKFFRGSNILTVDTDGTGLGIYLVRTIIVSSGGKIWFTSTVDKGTTFTFTLPLKGMKNKEGDVTLD